eukprot:TRINITY_DN21848_c0_g1_i1.p1 TRINITY_DN21848_c0_g1~~TRINITY_DN21848_c0_g1_i1.p1  ORF type:complete len:207 (-),score=53.90 TRINITY_DN21848_c0_g1_i1:46-645(-)
MDPTICYSCKEPLGEGTYTKIKKGAAVYPFHKQCFFCPVCKKDMTASMWHNGVFLCSTECRKTAIQEPSILPEPGTRWRKLDDGSFLSADGAKKGVSAQTKYGGAKALTNSGQEAVSLGSTLEQARSIVNSGSLQTVREAAEAEERRRQAENEEAAKKAADALAQKEAERAAAQKAKDDALRAQREAEKQAWQSSKGAN